MKVHFVDSMKSAACGAFNPKQFTQDHRSVSCASCMKSIDAAAKTGRMVFKEDERG